MKNTLFLTTALALGLGVNAQTTTTDTTAQQQAQQQMQQQQQTAVPSDSALTQTVTTQSSTSRYNARNPTVDSIASKYKLLPMPEALTLEKTFPAIGQYRTGADSSASLSITLDSVSKGIVWISGLPQGTVKAYLTRSPATYRILSQKTASGKQSAEGTLHYDVAANTLQIALGAPYDVENPTAIFPVAAPVVEGSTNGEPVVAEVKMKKETPKGKTKTKSKVTFYTFTKVQNAQPAAQPATAPANGQNQ